MSYYFYGDGIGNFTFYRVPKALLMDPEYKGMSTEAKLLYSLMLDRTTLSMMNNWKDQKGRIFIYFTVKEIMNEMKCCKQTAVNLLDELETFDLIERKKQGLGRPNKIFVKAFWKDILNAQDSIS